MAPLWNTANTDLGAYRERGGKLILWIGAADTVVQPASAVAYFQTLQANLGRQGSSSFARFFMLPGVKHCGGGEGPDQIDVASAIMAWTEQGRAPDQLVAGKRKQVAAESTMPDAPFSEPASPVHYTRPIYPYPLVAHYRGHGDRDVASSYRAVRPRGMQSQPLPAHIAQFFGPDNQALYDIRNGILTKRQERK
jgi:feruloyl esterase